MLANNWVRVPQDDDPMFGIRCYRPETVLNVREVHGQDFLHLSRNGDFVRREQANLTTGAWVGDRDMLTLFNDDVILDELKFVIEGDRLFIGG